MLRKRTETLRGSIEPLDKRQRESIANKLPHIPEAIVLHLEEKFKLKEFDIKDKELNRAYDGGTRHVVKYIREIFDKQQKR